MSTFYARTAMMGWSNSHIWSRWLIHDPKDRWYVCGTQAFTRSGFAAIDDFGDLVEVPQ